MPLLQKLEFGRPSERSRNATLQPCNPSFPIISTSSKGAAERVRPRERKDEEKANEGASRRNES